MFSAVATEDGALLGRKFHNNESVDACFFAVLHDPFLAIATEGVVVSHKDDGGLETLGSSFPDHVQAYWDIDLVFKCNLHDGSTAWRSEFNVSAYKQL